MPMSLVPVFSQLETLGLSDERLSGMNRIFHDDWFICIDHGFQGYIFKEP